MAWEGIGRKLERDRPPRVHITISVDNKGAIEEQELPFVMGVLADFVGRAQGAVKPLRDRQFVEVTANNLDDVLKAMAPHVQFSVENKLLGGGPDTPQLSVDLTFEKLADFEPPAVAGKLAPLAELLQERTKLANLREILTDEADGLLLRTVSATVEKTGPSGGNPGKEE